MTDVMRSQGTGRRGFRCLWLMLYCAAIGPAHAVDGTACEHTAAVSEVGPGAYLRSGTPGVVFAADNVANAGFIVGKRCVAVVDTGGSEAEGRALDCAIAAVTEVPVCYVINTHMHPDHILGNRAFKRSGVEFIGHSKLAQALAFVGDTYLTRAAQHENRNVPADYLVVPTRIVESELRLDLGDRTLTLTTHPTAHTTNDLTVYDESSSILWTGDLVFVEHIPVLHGSILGWLRVLNDFNAESVQRVIPGHGPVQAAWPDAAGATRRYLTTLRDELRAWIAAGEDLRSAQSKVGYSERDRWQLFDQYHKRNVASAFAELEWED